MTFLQPWVLWALPLVFLPVLIHLLNRLRHRPQPWAAMRFLVFATKTSTSQAKLRQFLILLFRVLALVALALFLSRPLSGGWLGWAVAPAPDVILLLMDRSASMETRIAAGGETRREQAVRLFMEAAAPFEGSSQLVLIDSAGRNPQTLSKLADLKDLNLVTPTGTSADILGLLQTSLRWLLDNRAGTAELWIASDLQKSNWLPEDARWKDLSAQLASLPQKVRVRLLAANGVSGLNRAVRLEEMIRRKRGARSELAMTLDFQQSEKRTEPVPVAMTLNGVRTDVDVALDSQDVRWRQINGVDPKSGTGWGRIELPADANPGDNSAFYTYGEETPLRAMVVSAEPAVGRVLRIASSAAGQGTNGLASLVSHAASGGAGWDRETLVVWQGVLPQGAASEKLRRWVQEGGVVIFLPPGSADAGRFEGLGWGELATATEAKPFRVLRWDETQGPLAKTDEGLSLPVSQTLFLKRQSIVGGGNVLAAFDDGLPLMVRQVLGQGEVYFCGTLPAAAWSSLSDGPVLVPMMQRLLALGARRLQTVGTAECGALGLADLSKTWASVDAPGKDIRTQPGVYKSGERLLAVNRPKAEDDPELVDATVATGLFGVNSVRLWEGNKGGNDSIQGEIWRMFVMAMLVFLGLEGWLMLPPPRRDESVGAGPNAGVRNMGGAR